MKFILNILRRLASLVYAVTVFPVGFAAAACIGAAFVMLMPIEWIITGDAKYTAAGIIFLLSDYPGYLCNFFKIISGE